MKKENWVFFSPPGGIVREACWETFPQIFLDFTVHYSNYIMSDIEISDSDDSYHPEDDLDASDSEDYSSLDSEINESDDESFISLGGGWARVDVFADKRPDPLPPKAVI